MAYSDVAITAGSGTPIAVDVVGGLDLQVIKLDFGASGASLPAVADGSGFLKVNLAAQALGAVVVNNPTAANLKVDASGVAVPITDNAGSLTVDAPVATPVFVRLSDGTNPIATLPVSGTVTANQGTAAAAASAWPTKISDGTDTVGISTVSAAKALKVDVVQTVGPGAQADEATFTQGTTPATVAAAIYTTSPSSPSSGQSGALQMTQKRGLHINLRDSSGAEMGTDANAVRTSPSSTAATQPVSGTVAATLSASTNGGAAVVTSDYDTGGGTQTMTMFGLALPASGGSVQGGTASNPVRVDPTGTTTQPVNNTQINGNAIVTVANGVQKVAVGDSTGAAITAANPFITIHKGQSETQIRSAVAFTASASDQAFITPTAGKKFYVRKITITVVTSGSLKIFDGTNAAANMIYQGTPPVGAIIPLSFDEPWASSTINNVLKWTTGSGATGDIVYLGYEA